MKAMEQKQPKKLYQGYVVSDAMDKTIVVAVDRTYMHPHVAKIVSKKKKYKVHDEQQEAKVGDLVEFHEGRPASKTKYMYLSRIIKPAATE